MTVSAEARIKELEGALRHLQKMQEERYEELNDELLSRSESQLSLLQYIFKKHQMTKEVIRSLANKAQIAEKELEGLWAEAAHKVAENSVPDEIFKEYRKELERDNG